MKIRYLNEQDVKTVAKMKLQHWQTVYRGMVEDDFLDSLSLAKEERQVSYYVKVTTLSEKMSKESVGTINKMGHMVERMKFHIVIAEDDKSEIAGFCIFGYRLDESSPTRSFNDYDYQIHELYVSQVSRKRGVGRVLTEFVFKEAIKLGQEKILLKAHAKNYNAIDFYKKIGGRVLGKSEVELGNKIYPQIVIGFQLAFDWNDEHTSYTTDDRKMIATDSFGNSIEYAKLDPCKKKMFREKHFEKRWSELKQYFCHFEMIEFETLAELLIFLRKNPKMGVYVITNNFDARVYIGRAKNLKQRMRMHFNEDNIPSEKAPPKLLKSYRQHKNSSKKEGLTYSVAIIILEEEKYLSDVEAMVIRILEAKRWGYNCTHGTYGK